MESKLKSSKGYWNDIIAEVQSNQADLTYVVVLVHESNEEKELFTTKMQDFQSKIEELCHALDAASTTKIETVTITGSTEELKVEITLLCNQFQSM
eukprot:1761878-Ditylum_brightwellii.AAC.1